MPTMVDPSHAAAAASAAAAPPDHRSSSSGHGPTRVCGRGMWNSWTRNFQSPLLAFLDLLDNSFDAALPPRQDRQSEVNLNDVESVGAGAELSEGQSVTLGVKAESPDVGARRRFRGTVEIETDRADASTRPAAAARDPSRRPVASDLLLDDNDNNDDDDDASAPQQSQQEQEESSEEAAGRVTGLVVTNNSHRPIKPIGEIMVPYSSAKGREEHGKVDNNEGNNQQYADTIGENGVGLKQSAATLSDLSFVLVRDGERLSLGILARRLQTDEGICLKSFEFDARLGGVNRHRHASSCSLEREMHRKIGEGYLGGLALECVAEYGEGSASDGIQRLVRHFLQMREGTWKEDTHVFRLVMNNLKHEAKKASKSSASAASSNGDTSDADDRESSRLTPTSNAEQFLREVKEELPRRYIHVPDDFVFRVSGHPIKFRYWQTRLVDICSFERTIDTVTPVAEQRDDWQDPTGDKTYKIRILCGFDPNPGPSVFDRAAKLSIHSRHSGRLIKEKRDCRAQLGLNSNSSDFCQGLRIIVDDVGGHLPLDPTKQEVAFGEQSHGAVHERNLNSWIGAVTHVYYTYHKKRFGESKNLVTKAVEAFKDILPSTDASIPSIEESSFSTLLVSNWQIHKKSARTEVDVIRRSGKGEFREIVGLDTRWRLKVPGAPSSETKNGRGAQENVQGPPAVEDVSTQIPSHCDDGRSGDNDVSTSVGETCLSEGVNPNPNDVICGRGHGVNSQNGNQYFLALVKSHTDLFRRSESRAGVAAQIVKMIRSLDPPGRFLKRNEETGHWCDIGDDDAKLETMQALMDISQDSPAPGDSGSSMPTGTSATMAGDGGRQSAEIQVPSRDVNGKEDVDLPTGGESSVSARLPDGVNPNDVLFCRGCDEHPGNRFFKTLVIRDRDRYRRSTNKAAVAAEIVEVIRSRDPPGRFLKKDKEAGGGWRDIGYEKAKEALMHNQALMQTLQESSGHGDTSSGSSMPTGTSTTVAGNGGHQGGAEIPTGARVMMAVHGGYLGTEIPTRLTNLVSNSNSSSCQSPFAPYRSLPGGQESNVTAAPAAAASDDSGSLMPTATNAFMPGAGIPTKLTNLVSNRSSAESGTPSHARSPPEGDPNRAPSQLERPPPHQAVPQDETAGGGPMPQALPQIRVPPTKKGGESAHSRSHDANNAEHQRHPGVRVRSPSTLPLINIPPPKKGRKTMDFQPPSSQNSHRPSSNSAPSSDDDAPVFLGVRKADELEDGKSKANNDGLALELKRARQGKKELEADKRELRREVDGLRGQVEELEQDLAYERQENNSLRERIQLLEERLRRSRRVEGTPAGSPTREVPENVRSYGFDA